VSIKAVAAGTAPDAIPVIAQNANVATAKAKLNDLQAQKVKLLERYPSPSA